MRKMIFLFLSILCLYTVQAQNGNVYISVAMPSDYTLSSNVRSILKNKLLRIISIEGVAGTECGAIVVVPEVNTVNSNVIDGGMRRITSLDLEITVSVRNIITSTVFNTIQIPVSGEGYSEDEAKRNAIDKINVSTPEYVSFVKATKSKILDYYHSNTTALITKANTLTSMQAFDEALALLSTYPETLSGYAKVSVAMTSIFKKCQTQYCSQILQSAQAAYAQGNYDEAASIVSMIDAQSSCATQAKSLLNSIKKSLDKQYNDALAMEKEKIAMEKERMLSQERIKTAGISAIRDVAKAYFQRQTKYIFF